MQTFDDYKSKISIIQLLEDIGYRQDKKDGKISPVFKLKNDKGEKLDEVVIKNPGTPNERYFDRNYHGGDLIQFVKNHINDFPQFNHPNLFVRINMILGHYSNTPYTPKNDVYKAEKTNRGIGERYQELKPAVTDLRYLTKERGLSYQTVETFLPHIRLVKDLEAGNNYKNIAFPYVNPSFGEKVTNYEMRNFGYKGMAAGGDKSSSLWLADFSPHSSMAKHIYFAESALDAMSYYELNRSKIKLDESVFCSVGGYISEKQITNALAKYPNASVHTLFDNDLNGNIYDIKVMGIMAGVPVNIKEKDGMIEFTTPKGTFSLDKEKVSIEKFREGAHFNAPLQVHKANDGKDFNEILQKKNSHNQKMKL